MSRFIGQTKLMSILDSYTPQTLPKTLMFIGAQGCGKHTLAKYLANKFEFDLIEIDDGITSSQLESFLYSTVNKLYLIDLNKFSEKQQNQVLKFTEEPSSSVYIILLANSEVNVLNTIINRCVKYHFEPYTKEQIEAILNTNVNDLAFTIYQTPGKLLNLTENSFKNVLSLAGYTISEIGSLPYANALAIGTKINYKDLYNKIDFNLFFDTVEYLAFEAFKKNNNMQSFTIFKVTNQFKQYSTKQNLIKETLMLNYLTTLWEALQV